MTHPARSLDRARALPPSSVQAALTKHGYRPLTPFVTVATENEIARFLDGIAEPSVHR